MNGHVGGVLTLEDGFGALGAERFQEGCLAGLAN